MTGISAMCVVLSSSVFVCPVFRCLYDEEAVVQFRAILVGDHPLGPSSSLHKLCHDCIVLNII